MGINWPDITFLLVAQRLGVVFERTLTIGRQNLYADTADVRKGYSEAGECISAAAAARIVDSGGAYAESMLEHLGARRPESLDASSYEGATHVYDLNRQLPSEFRAKYTLVFDGGSLEHVFDFPRALANCLEAVALGGHFVTITPANNLFGHGFYQFSPELYYRALAPSSGFQVKLVVLRAVHRWARWWAIGDPRQLEARTTMTSPWPSLLYVLAQRTELTEPFRERPTQSDYALAWTMGGSALRPPRHPLKKRLLVPVRRLGRVLSTVSGTQSGPGHFQPVDMARVGRVGAQTLVSGCKS